MRASVVIVWHNRPKNLEYWTSIISKVDRTDTAFTVIHNCEVPSPAVQKQVEDCGARYIARRGIGMDIGALQDVCRKRLRGFDYNYEFLLWFTDDCFPMRENFVNSYLVPFLDQTTGISCLEISSQIRRHIRTTGFCIRRTFAEKLLFPADPVKTKEECYRFEHRGPNSLYEQILAAKLNAVQIAALRESPAWDSGGGGHGWINRRQEFEKQWGTLVKGSKVLVIAPAFERLPVIVSSMLAQTYHNWELHLVHSGPAPNDYPKFEDSRIIFTETPSPRGHYGHPTRETYLQLIRAGKLPGDYVVITNDDNYHAPFYLEKLVKALDENPDAPAAYCSAMVHNYAGYPGQVPAPGKDHVEDGYNVIQIKAERGFIDCAAVMVRAKAAGACGWPDYTHSSDWTYLNRIAQTNGGWGKFKVVPGVLLVHN